MGRGRTNSEMVIAASTRPKMIRTILDLRSISGNQSVEGIKAVLRLVVARAVDGLLPVPNVVK